MTATTYTLRPTYSDPDMTILEDYDWFANWSDEFENDAIAYCREHNYSGAHIFSGAYGPVYGTDGYEENYCGWIDARVGAEKIAS